MDALFIFFFLKMTSPNIPVWDFGPGLSQSGAGSVNLKRKTGYTLKPRIISGCGFYRRENREDGLESRGE